MLLFKRLLGENNPMVLKPYPLVTAIQTVQLIEWFVLRYIKAIYTC